MMIHAGTTREPIDMIGREAAIQELFNAVETVHLTKQGIALGLNGEWGCGKTFVLQKLEKRLDAARVPGIFRGAAPYFVVHYNCWQYDYYDEPLTAIISAFRDKLREHIKNVGSTDPDRRKILLTAACICGSVLVNIAKSKFGLPDNIEKLLSNIPDDLENASNLDSLFEQSNPLIDQMIPFTESVNKIRSALRRLAKKYTIVIVVDELDRCLPHYAIKVLERLHHIFDGMGNCAMIVATDKTQLGQVVRSCFGHNTNPDVYLRKFVHCTYNLRPKRNENGKFDQKYASYFRLFRMSPKETELCNRYLIELFDDIDMRTQEILLLRAELLHRLILSTEQDNPYILLLVEIMLVVFYHYEISNELECDWDLMLKNPFIVDSQGRIRLMYQGLHAFQVFIEKNWGMPQQDGAGFWSFDQNNKIANAFIGSWCIMCEGRGDQHTAWTYCDPVISQDTLRQLGKSLRKNW